MTSRYLYDLDSYASSAEDEKMANLPYSKHLLMRDLYNHLDVDSNGRIDMKELLIALKHEVPSLPETTRKLYAKELMKAADSHHTNDIDFAEFVSYVTEHEKKLQVVFSDLDRNSDGNVDVDEIQKYFERLGLRLSLAEAGQILEKMDYNNNCAVDFDEFCHYLLLHPSSDPKEIAYFWRHHIVIDMGEEGLFPQDFTDEELSTGTWWQHLVAGGVAGANSRTAAAPLERVKVFLQINRNFGFNSAVRHLLLEGGVKSLWRGNFVNVLKIAPESALKFSFYEKIKTSLKQRRGNDLNMVDRFVAGSVAGTAAQSSIYPLEVLKTRFMLRKTEQHSKGIIDAVKTIYKYEGWRSFYRGYVPNVLAVFPCAGINFSVYETLKLLYLRHQSKVLDPGVHVYLACGAISCTCGQVASYPLFLIRTRLQASPILKSPKETLSLRAQFELIYKSDGIRGFYRGLLPNLIKVVPSASVSYFVYEKVESTLGIKIPP